MSVRILDLAAIVTSAIVIITCVAIMPFMPPGENGDPIGGIVMVGIGAVLYAIGRAEEVIK